MSVTLGFDALHSHHGHDNMESFRLPGAPAEGPSERPTFWLSHSVCFSSWQLSVMQNLLRISVFIHSELSPTRVISLCQSHLSLGSERSWALGLWGSVWISSRRHPSHCFCSPLAPSSGKLWKINEGRFTASSLKWEAFTRSFPSFRVPCSSVTLRLFWL